MDGNYAKDNVKMSWFITLQKLYGWKKKLLRI